ncbi:type II toxin-antitoxin system RelE/ParE family toxin [Desulfosporosinus sp. BICA1-9]|uniref:type II toxin-antitoxin system RelE/ParE family toxin n=1 Tax=Desulfosporosinus sp. BICA1-9 TaxID=1531958 RepID=UPI00054B82C8|nr:type II toxin-antitoxin system RelE/ParE family toxin [Desulfosporosinus sp. BICA1-9]KJS48430.1 MAG: toxin RelE [Peptococcaceae bacterium BRH_c23]KJS77961.1 MAG: toxin RelE [Desulfosporosinus sp. BICA1-9]HBW35065.1 type II toxin-antitoxin system RelE/ParE family toxin [Desulfosporosinus sp.]
MDKFTIKLLPRAYRDIDQIYGHILEVFMVTETAENLVKSVEDAILGLEEFPHRGSERKVGVYANRGYRQLFIKNFTIVYRIDEKMKCVIIVTVKYSPSCF